MRFYLFKLLVDQTRRDLAAPDAEGHGRRHRDGAEQQAPPSLTTDNIATWVPDSGHFTPSHSVREKQDRRGESRGI